MAIMATPRVPIYPHGWREIVNASLEEKFSSLALGSLDTLITADFIPSPEHIQFLLYLTLRPTSNIPPSTPISILYKLLSLHSLSAGSVGAITNALPRCDGGKGDWLGWDYKRSEIHRSIYKLMRRGTDGIWGILYAPSSSRDKRLDASKKRRRRDVQDVDGDDDDDDEGEVQKELSEEGWLVLEWLVDVWEKDRQYPPLPPPLHIKTVNENDNRASMKGQLGYSSSFLEQLPRPHDSTNTLQRSNASAPLAILRAAFVDLSTSGAVEKNRRQGIATRIFYLLLDTVLYPNSPPFHAASFLSSIIHLYKQLSLDQMTNLHQSLLLSLPAPTDTDELEVDQSMRYRRALGHLYTLLIEDLAGVRQERSAERQKRSSKSRQRRPGIVSGTEKQAVGKKEEDEEDFGSEILDWPTRTYLLNVLLLPAHSNSSTSTRHSSNDNDEDNKKVDEAYRMIYFKLILVNLISTRNDVQPPKWETIKVGDVWWNKFLGSLAPRGQGEVEEASMTKNKSLATLLKIRVKDVILVQEEDS